MTRHQTLADRNQSVNWRYFDGPWTPEKAYILGYLWADGTVYDEKGHTQLKLECHSQDEDVLLWVRSQLSSVHKVSYQPAGKYAPNEGPKTICQICSTNLVRVLVDRFGILPRKSSLDCRYPGIPSRVFNHFVRGYSDGDGCISSSQKSRQWYVAGSPKFIAGMQVQISEQVGVPKFKLHEQGKIRKAIWAAKGDLRLIFAWLYRDGTFSGGRKRAKFEQMIAGF